MKKLKTIIFIVLACLSMSFTSLAHSGRTDSAGGHHDYQNKSGLGSYHFHCGGYPPHLHPGGVCPYGNGMVSNNLRPSVSETPSITVNNAPQNMGIGDVITLDYSWHNTLKDTRTVTSSNEEIIRVVDEDTLEAVSEGVATITIKTKNAETSFTVDVKPVLPTSIEITNKIDKVQLNTSLQLEFNVKPDNTTDKTVTWSSSNSDIASIDSDGFISAKSTGDVIITGTANNGIKIDVPLNIYEVYPESIETNIDDLDIECTKMYRLNVTIKPDNANNKSYNIAVKNDDIACVNNTNIITGLKDGDTELIIRTHNNITKTIPLHIYHIPVDYIEIDDSNIDYFMSAQNLKIINKGQDLKLDIDILPKNATYKDVEWKSDNENVISTSDNNLQVIGKR